MTGVAIIYPVYYAGMHIAVAGRWMAILNLLGLACGLLGGVLLALSLELKSSNFRLVEGKDKQVAICLNNKKVAAGYGGPLVVSDEPCPDMIGTGPTPQVIANRPGFVTAGVILIVIEAWLAQS
jgi:hypothetical protein